jgi:hypothetical protein
MAETTDGAGEMLSALELTHRRLRLLVKRAEEAGLPEDAELSRLLRLSRRQLRQNRREILGEAKKQERGRSAGDRGAGGRRDEDG